MTTVSGDHRLFLLTLWVKAVLGVIQLGTAAAIFAGVAARLPAAATWLFQAELTENPADFIAMHVISLVGLVPGSDLTFYAAYFSAHGALHIAIVAALIWGAGWAHRAAVAVLWIFVVYQMAEWMSVGGPTLLLLTAIDLLVIWITIRDHRRTTLRLS